MNTRTQSFVLLLFGGALVRLGVSDLLLRYVRPVARPWVLLAGLTLLLLAAVRLVQAHRAGADRLPAVRTGWLMVAPVVAILVIAPPALGAFSANRTPVALTNATTGSGSFPALAGSSPHRVGMLDYATRVLWDAGRTVTGQQVRLTGFVLADRPDGFVLARLVITCCAADARPIEIIVHSTMHPATDTWLDVTGTDAGVDPDQPTFPVLRAAAVTTVPAPANPYDGS